MAYNLGPVRPHVKAAADSLGSRFAVKTIYGFAQRDYQSEHPLGLALDFMTYEDKAKGQAIYDFVKQNHKELSVKYVIFAQRIWSPERANEGDRPMTNRGNPTANHMDHVHVSFNATAPQATSQMSKAGCGLVILLTLMTAAIPVIERWV